MRRLSDGELWAGLLALFMIVAMVLGVANKIESYSVGTACIKAGGSWTQGVSSDPDTCARP